MTLHAASAALEGQLIGPDGSFSGVSTDTRTLGARQLFFALRGPRFDAHDRLGEIGVAAGAVVERPGTVPASQIRVPSTRKALGLLARHWRDRYSLPVLAVTGSAGKTTVKEMLAAILRQAGRVLATEGNLNNDIGVPQTLFGLGKLHQYAVIEMGANRRGDIAELVAIARPQVGILTLCAPAHLEGFGDLETVAMTKGEIIAGLAEDGVAVINADDAFAPLWRELAEHRRVITFGDAGMVSAHDVNIAAAPTTFTLSCVQGEIGICLPHRGTHNVRNALAAAAAALAVNIPLDLIRAGLACAPLVAGRLEQRELGDGLRLINDTYNANPASLDAAIAVLANEPGRRWLVLGDMAELGEEAANYHRVVGATANRAGVERLFSLGEFARMAEHGFGGIVRHCMDRAELIEALLCTLKEVRGERTTILLKGSRVMALDQVADALSVRSRPAC